MYEYLFEASATNYLRDGNAFETLCKRVKSRLVVLDQAEYKFFVFGTGARELAEDIAYYVCRSREEREKYEPDAIRILGGVKESYLDFEAANARNVSAMPPKGREEYRERMVTCLSRDLKNMASPLTQLYMALKDRPIQKGDLHPPRKPGGRFRFDL